MQILWAKVVAFFLSVLAFLGLIQTHNRSVNVTADGIITDACCTDADCGETTELNITLPMQEKLQGSLDCSVSDLAAVDNATILYYDSTDFDGYIAALKNLGARVKANYTLGKNRYAFLRHDYFTVYVSALSEEKALRVYIGRSDDALPRVKPILDKRCCTPSLWQLNIDNEAASANGGMGYILQLTDGRFIVVDGGYKTESDARAIYEILNKYKPAWHRKPIVAGWFITHMHIDHYGALIPFTEKYLDSVRVEGFYYNFPYIRIGDLWPPNNPAVENIMTRWPDATIYRKLHSGMTIPFSGAEVTVLCTFEDVYPQKYEDGNDTSLVFKVTLGGQSVLFLGDAEYGENDRLTMLDKKVLHADILQYAHHGYDKQCRKNLYELIDPSVVLWPMPLVNYESGTRSEVFAWRYENRGENAWIRTAPGVRKIILKDEGPTRLCLPYTPEGDRITDYKALYEKLK